MPALKPTTMTAQVLWLGQVPQDPEGIRSATCTGAMQLDWGGVAGSNHAGVNRASCVRVRTQYPQGTEIRNTRQLSIVSAEELAQIAAETGLEEINPEWLGASMVIKGIPDFTHVPPSSRLMGADGLGLVVDMENRPCQLPAREIEKDRPGHGKGFKAAARHRRGVTAWVEHPGLLSIGDHLTLHIPDQPVWPHLSG
ncbi:MAG: sulfurase [Pelagimonas sp.]|nr:sulfurase [Pelagimonas sp.]